jgi:diaminopimelate decarboxylase
LSRHDQSPAAALPEHPADDQLIELAGTLGTPYLVHDLDLIAAQAAEIRQAYADELPCEVVPTYALKANYLPDVLDTVLADGWGVEVMSGFELEAALGMIPAAAVTLTGLGWGAAVARNAVHTGVGRFVVDSERDLDDLAAAARAEGRTVSVLPRLNLVDVAPDGFLGRDGRHGSLPGPDFDRMVVRARSQGLRVAGLHQFNRLTDPDVYGAVVREACRQVARLDADEVDIGGGLAAAGVLGEHGVSVADFARAAGEAVREVPGVATVRLEVGRALVGDAGRMVATVRAIKRSAGRTWVVVDAPTNTLIPIPGAQYTPRPLGMDPSSRPLVRCSVSDGTGSPVALATDVVLPDPRPGDLVVLDQCGAYTTVFTELWAAGLPTLVTASRAGGLRVRDGAATTAATWRAWYGPEAWAPPTDGGCAGGAGG